MDNPVDPTLMDLADGRLRLRGGRCAACDEIHFPVGTACPRCGGDDIRVEPLADEGVLWSWTVQRFPPPSPPYVPSAAEFTPFGLGYVELPGQVIVESLLTECDPARLHIGMPMRLVEFSVPTESGETAVTFAFTPWEGHAS
ncbi:Zn-ribbon domain-containing OB-fold protein [Nocardia sp. XZ_19_385]|uniref:Zn-ribbon domain-containing OB-fold protein n=1 Tax=Nocardia sp. XZ_19_385 TaxID=2769488 RepID=UPI001E5F1438|nr:OB-fold domain-containing protein [Nocardia sp. XZ_19_385]